MLMTLGFFVFDTPTVPVQSIDRDTSWRFASSTPIGARPVYQSLGPGEDKLSLTGTLYPEFTGGRAGLDLLRNMAEQGKGWPLIEGSGRNYGFWSITAIKETSTHLMRDGTPQKITFSIDLVRVDEKQLDFLGTAKDVGLQAVTGLLAKPLSKLQGILGSLAR